VPPGEESVPGTASAPPLIVLIVISDHPVLTRSTG
jgi:hypothetical protein